MQLRTAVKVVALGCVLLVLAGISRTRTAVWHRDDFLWADAVRTAPEKPRVHLNLGRDRALQGRYAEAVQHYLLAEAGGRDPRRGAMERHFVTAAAQNNRAHVLVASDPDAAIYLLQATAREFPWFAPAYEQLALVWCEQGKFDAATQAMRDAATWDREIRPTQCAPVLFY